MDGNIRNLPFGPIQYGQQCTIAAINILAKFELVIALTVVDAAQLHDRVIAAWTFPPEACALESGVARM